ncbi:hypothetical protein ACFXPY_39725 [Streptomyces sp. NPDC059153]|uniref:hypothetical protein n=1 Tax=Streptomyces sp. NPDC059153 TaxID=3346743 RepID=UPI00369C569F
MSQWTDFWELIDLGIHNPEDLRGAISRMPEADLVEFYWTYEEAAADLKDEEFTKHLNPPRTEDFIDDVAQWVVSQGLSYYESIMVNPSMIPPELPPDAHPSPWTGTVSRIYRTRYGAPVRFREDPPPETRR